MAHSLLQSVIAMMALTFSVWAYMYVLRVRYIVVNRVSNRNLATPELLNAALPEHVNRPSNNLKNLFELPVIFYGVCSVLLALQQADAMFVNLAWTFVVLRAAHSAVHCTLNIVPLRFAFYALSSLALWAMVVRLAVIAV